MLCINTVVSLKAVFLTHIRPSLTYLSIHIEQLIAIRVGDVVAQRGLIVCHKDMCARILEISNLLTNNIERFSVCALSRDAEKLWHSQLR